MNLVLSGPIDDSLRNAVVEVTKPSGIYSINARALRFEDADDSLASATAIARLCKNERVDHSYVEPSFRLSNFRLLAIDMDSTLITIECIDEMADFAGKKAQVAAITNAVMNGELHDFAESLRRRVALLAGLDTTVLKSVYDARLNVSDGGEELLLAAQSFGLYIILISGGFTYFARRLAEWLPINASYANELEVVNDQLTGRVKGPIIGAQEKAQIVQQTMINLQVSKGDALVIGDGSNDIPMMELVDHSIAYRGRPAVVSTATHSIEFGSLRVATDYLSYS